MIPLISVIVPVYNVSAYLRRCLDSILNNTWNNLEIICVNDGSTDESLEILWEYANKDARIVIIDQENGGVSAARNAGLSVAKGEVIAFVDSDDWVHSQYFELMMHAYDKSGADCVICGIEQTCVVSSDERMYDTSNVNVFSESLSDVLKNRMAKTRIWGRIYKKELIADIRYAVGIRFAEDTIFNLTALCCRENTNICRINENLYYYFMRPDSAMHTLAHSVVGQTIPYYLASYGKINNSSHRIHLLDQAYCAFFRLAMHLCFDRKQIQNGKL